MLERSRKFQKFLYEFLTINSCVDCSEKNLLVLDFDHVFGKKEFNIGKSAHNSKNLDQIKKEIEKCEIRCRNCHAKRHHEEINSYRWKFFNERKL